MTARPDSSRLAVIGGGVSGLVAAFRLRQTLGPAATIEVFEAADRFGGLLHTVDLAGHGFDVGAEAFIVRRPEALDLVAELGLTDDLVHPAGRRPSVWSAGRLHPLPAPALMGIPAAPEVVADLVDPADLARMADEPQRPLDWVPGTDCSVGELVAARFGPSVVARSVDPMLGGVYSSLAGDIGVREAIPALAARLDAGTPNLTAAVNDLVGAGAGGGPVFGALRGGYRQLVDALLAAADPIRRPGTPVTAVHADGTAWLVETASGTGRFDGVIVAVPAWQAAPLLAAPAPAASSRLAAVEAAPSVVLALAFEPGTALPDHSGVLVATDAGDLTAKAFTFSSQKWDHLAADGRPVTVRASFGRYRAPVAGDDPEETLTERLTTAALADLDRICAAAGLPGPSAGLIDRRLQRWDGGLPVYRPGHLAHLAGLAELLPDGLAVAGAAYDGVGVPACIGRAGRAAAAVAAACSR